MSEEQDVRAAGWVDRADGPNGRPAPTGATAVVPGQRTQGEPVAADPAPEAPVPQPAAQSPDEPAGRSPVPPAGPQVSAPQASAAQQEAPPPPPAPAPPAGAGEAGPEHASTPYPTTPVGIGVRTRPRVPRPDPLTRMGPWAPVAGALVGLALGVVVVLLLAPAVDTFDQRLSLVFVVLGLTLLGAGGTLLADEVRMLRRGAAAAEVRASNAEVIAGLLNRLTPARLLITASAFVLLLSAYVTSGT